MKRDDGISRSRLVTHHRSRRSGKVASAIAVALSLGTTLSACGANLGDTADAGLQSDEALPPAASPMAPAAASPPPAVQPNFLLTMPGAIPPATLDKIRAVPGLRAMAPIGYTTVRLYDLPLRLAAVEPISFRPFTPPDTLRSAGVWEALDRGSALVTSSFASQARLPLDVTVPVAGSAVRITGHVSTVPGIDMTVSRDAGRAMGLVGANGLVIGVTGDLRAAERSIRTIAGAAAEVQPIVSAPMATLPPIGTPSTPPTASPTPPATPSTPSPGAPAIG